MQYSIITINYNNKVGLEQTISSVLNQVYKDYQLIIIDGGSSDGSVDIIKKYEKHISYWVSEPDKGRYNAMNKGIMQATGDYINFMNSGDTFHNPTVLKDVASMNLNEDIITGGFYNKDKEISHIIKPQEVTLLTMLKETFNHQATFFNKRLFKNRLYDEKYIIQSDFKFNLQCIINDNCSIRIIDNIIADYDFNGISSNKELVYKERHQLLTELFPVRVMKDYEKMYTTDEVPIIKLLPELKKHSSIQQWVFKFALFLLKCKSLFK